MSNPAGKPARELREKLLTAWQLHQSGSLDSARAMYREILAAAPKHPDANNLMGLACIQAGIPREAVFHIRRALKSEPRNPQSHYNLGIALKDLGEMPAALQSFLRACRLAPGNIEFISSLGNAQRLCDQPAEAVRTLEKALHHAPRHVAIKQNLALALNDLGARYNREGNPEQALHNFRKAIEYYPDHAHAHLNLGISLEQAGEFDAAIHHYQESIRSRPDLADAHFHLAHLRLHPSSAEEIGAMQRLLDKPGVSEAERIMLSFGLGFALEKAGHYQQAFAYMKKAHATQARSASFDRVRETARFEAIRKAFLPANAWAGEQDERNRCAVEPRAAHQASAGEPNVVFIVGMPRSGTTLTEQILASHPDVHAMGERTALARAANRLVRGAQGVFPDGMDRVPEKRILAEGRRYMNELPSRAAGSKFVTDTTPMNFQFVGLAARMFPGARFLVCSRQALDNCLSLYRQYLTGANEYAHRLEDLGAYYRLHQRLVEHWRESLPDRVHRVRYESLIESTEREVTELLNFCGLEAHEDCLHFHRTRRSVQTPSAAQVRQPIFSTSVNAWKNYETQLAPLKKALGYEQD